jgi:hypothetical protein
MFLYGFGLKYVLEAIIRSIFQIPSAWILSRNETFYYFTIIVDPENWDDGRSLNPHLCRVCRALRCSTNPACICYACVVSYKCSPPTSAERNAYGDPDSDDDDGSYLHYWDHVGKI